MRGTTRHWPTVGRYPMRLVGLNVRAARRPGLAVGLIRLTDGLAAVGGVSANLKFKFGSSKWSAGCELAEPWVGHVVRWAKGWTTPPVQCRGGVVAASPGRLMRYYHDDHYTPVHPLSQASYRASGRAALPFWRCGAWQQWGDSGEAAERWGRGAWKFETQIIGSGPWQGFDLAEESGRIDGGSE